MNVAKTINLMQKGLLFLHTIWNEIATNLMTAFAGAIVTWLFNPKPKFWHNFVIMVGSVILGTLIGYSIDHSSSSFLHGIKYGIITLFGLYAEKLYKYLGKKMHNPLGFISEIQQSINKESLGGTEKKKKNNQW